MIIGSRPKSLTVNLTRDSDLLCSLKATEAYETGTTIELELKTKTDTHTYEATIVTDTATFNVDYLEVNQILDEGPTTARLFYYQGDVDLLWAKGTVKEV